MSRRVIGEVRLDSRGRVNLGPECGNKLYFAYQEHDGTIVLQPAKIVPLKDDRADGARIYIEVEEF